MSSFFLVLEIYLLLPDDGEGPDGFVFSMAVLSKMRATTASAISTA
jgi:hypothetical protein